MAQPHLAATAVFFPRPTVQDSVLWSVPSALSCSLLFWPSAFRCQQTVPCLGRQARIWKVLAQCGHFRILQAASKQQEKKKEKDRAFGAKDRFLPVLGFYLGTYFYQAPTLRTLSCCRVAPPALTDWAGSGSPKRHPLWGIWKENSTFPTNKFAMHRLGTPQCCVHRPRLLCKAPACPTATRSPLRLPTTPNADRPSSVEVRLLGCLVRARRTKEDGTSLLECPLLCPTDGSLAAKSRRE
ncbi:hypothetical protein CCHR01_05492 [Colletotrichum chrysophilum]|uniref:Uncharacterized protein n=1 Tax=Colletotrichum chrysophilum TaxID=1836956 RepID=A0AAD9ELI6_9PEZI|nr:hypothetical protein CCHR01_05492 [Colletotrichum chrysophilum]